MLTATPLDLQLDHKHWLRDIQHWRWYLRLWSEQQRTLAEAAAQQQSDVQQHGDHLRRFSESLERHEHEIADCERMLNRSHTDDVAADLADRHVGGAHRHEQELHAYERLRQNHHSLMMQLALLRHEPFREE